MANGIEFTLVPAEGEPLADVDRQQKRMRRIPLFRVPRFPKDAMDTVGINLRASADVGAYAHLASLLSLAAQKAGPTLAGALATWVGTRAGRKVKIKVGDVEIEASNSKEIAELLDRAQAFKQANEPKRIHER